MVYAAHRTASAVTANKLKVESPRQLAIHRRLRLIGPGPAAFYRDALRLMVPDADALETRAHLLWHCLREIESAIRHVLVPLVTTPEAPANIGAKGNPDEGHRRQVLQILQTYQIAENSTVGRIWLELIDRKNSHAPHQLVHRNALMDPRRFDESMRERWNQWEILLTELLDHFESRFADHSPRLIALANTPPGTDAIKRLRNEFPNNDVTLTKFFSQIDAKWIPYLVEGGYFATPPDPDPTLEGSWFPPWPASRLLVRLATPDLDEAGSHAIGQAAVAIPATKNPLVHEDLAAAALSMPMPVATTVARSLCKHLGLDSLRLPTRLAKLALRFAQAGEPGPALEVVDALLMTSPREKTKDLWINAPRTAYNDHEFGKAARIVVRDIVPALGIQIHGVLCEALSRAVSFTYDNEEQDDGLWRVRTAIEDSPQNRNRGGSALNVLVNTLRDASETLARMLPGEIQTIVGNFERYPWLIFRRLALHCVCVNAEVARTLLPKYLLDWTTFESVPLWHERRVLERDCFHLLSQEDQEQFFERVLRGPSEEYIRRMHTVDSDADDIATARRQRIVRQWRRQHVTLIEGMLPTRLREEHLATIAELGPASHPEFLTYRSHERDQPTSPLSRDAVAAMSVSEIVDFLSNWQVPEGPDAHFLLRDSILDALGREIRSRSTRFAREAQLFQRLHPTYVRELVSNLAAAETSHKTFAWDAVIELCEWIVAQPQADTIEMRSALRAGIDPGWQWTRKAIAELLTKAFEGNAMGVDDLKMRAVAILSNLLRSVETTEGYTDPVEAAFNSVQGTAMNALVTLIRSFGKPDVDAPASKTEVRSKAVQLLEEHIAPERDDNATGRTMVGFYLANLATLDPTWVEAHLDLLFPREAPARDIVWRTYLAQSIPNQTTFRIFEHEYWRDMDQLRGGSLGAEHVEAIVNHLGPIYWWGLLDLKSALFVRFYELADEATRYAMLKSIGFAFLHADGPIPLETVERAKALWEKRAAEIQAAAKPTSEANAFGWWFVSTKFDDHWSLEQLGVALQFADDIDLDHSVADRLGELAPNHTDLALQYITQMSGMDDRDGWRTVAYRNGIESVVRAALSSTNDITKRNARELVSRLLAHGHEEYWKLLESLTTLPA